MADIETATMGVDDHDQPVVAMKSANPETLDVGTAWVTVTHLYCHKLAVRANAIDTAVLSYDFGKAMRQPGLPTGSVGTVARLSPVGKYVRITYGGQNWYGYVLRETTPRVGADAAGAEIGARQRFDVVGLEYFLRRVAIRSAVVHNGVRIARPLVFNGGRSADVLGSLTFRRGNMHYEDDANGQRGFYDLQDDADPGVNGPEAWSAADIVAHTLYYHNPRGTVDEPRPCEYRLSLHGRIVLADWKPTVRTQGRTPFDLLQSLISTRRGMCWWGGYVDMDDGNAPNGFYIIEVETLTPSAISLDQGGSLPANINQNSLSFDLDERAMRPARVAEPGGRAYRRVVCRGARQTATFSVGLQDSTLVESWTGDAQQAYREAASASDVDNTFPPGERYDDLDLQEKAKRNDAVRREEGVSRVFSAFALPFGWDGQAGDGISASKAPVFRDISPAGSVGAAQDFYWAGLRMLPYLPIAEASNTPPGDASQPAYAKPFAFVRVVDGGSSSEHRYAMTHELSDIDFAYRDAESGEPPKASYQLFPDPDLPGILLRSNKLAHTLAFGTALEPSEVAAEYSYLRLAATVCCEADAYAEGRYPDGIASGVPIEELVIDMGEAYRLDYLAPNTVYDIKGGKPVRATGGVVRNDQPALADFAKFAYEWYRANRRTLSVGFKRIDTTSFELGMLLTTLGQGAGEVTLNTVIGEIEWDFGSRTPATRVRTLGDELNLPELLS